VLRRGPRAASSEAESRLRVRQALERGGDLWCGTRSSSETEIRPRGTAADRLVGRCDFLGRGPFFALGRDHTKRVLGLWPCSFAFYYLFEREFSPVIRRPLRLSPTTSTFYFSSLPT
jgi:hypothetical protein